MRECVRQGRSTCHTDIHVQRAGSGFHMVLFTATRAPEALPSYLCSMLEHAPPLFRRGTPPHATPSLLLSSPRRRAWRDDGCGTMEQVRRVGVSALGSFIPKAVSGVGVYRRHTRSVITLPSLRFPSPPTARLSRLESPAPRPQPPPSLGNSQAFACARSMWCLLLAW